MVAAAWCWLIVVKGMGAGYHLEGQSKAGCCRLVSADHCQEHESLGRMLAVMHPAITDGLVKYNAPCKFHCM